MAPAGYYNIISCQIERKRRQGRQRFYVGLYKIIIEEEKHFRGGGEFCHICVDCDYWLCYWAERIGYYK